MRSRIAALAALLALALAVTPAAAVTRGGVPDGDEHPMVGQILFYNPDAPNSVYEGATGGWGSCTATLVSTTVLITAGHCTFATGLDGESTTTEDDRFTAAEGNGAGGNDVWVSFNEDADHWDGFPSSFNADGTPVYPNEQARYEARAAWAEANPLWQRGTSFPHPEYDDRIFWLHDLGVVELDEAVTGVEIATIAPLGYLEKYAQERRNEQRFEAVGYGLNRVLAGGVVGIGGDTRMQAHPKLNQINAKPAGTYIVLSNNAATGGTCYGDSGGPTFDNTDSLLIVGVTSFGVSPNCTGTGGVYRVDQPDDLAFLAGHGIEPAD